uniref:NADH:ubiquinone reductase (H(+)-translocating) n=1 Tax=Meloidogyne floridensis TaxID=298350 RepID=A0A915NT27_9BILA
MDNLLLNPSTLIDATNSINGQGGKTFSELIGSNPLFTGGAGLVGVGIILSYFRRLSLIGKELLKRKFISRLELDNTDMFVLFLKIFGDVLNRLVKVLG